MNQVDLQHYIDDQIEESLTLEYKAADALGRSDGKKKEITKDVSAMANSAGGRLIYGIKEFPAPQQHRPQSIDPIDRTQFSKEWLEQVISTVRPRIPDVLISSIQLALAPTHVAYVVDVPQATTAHQATDCRYYRRYNFEATMMLDHEIRDVMGRRQHPRIVIAFELVAEMFDESARSFNPGTPEEMHRSLRIRARNDGPVLARYINGNIHCPVDMIEERERRGYKAVVENGQTLLEIPFDNDYRDFVNWEKSNRLIQQPIFGPGRFVPLLPGLERELSAIIVDTPGTERSQSVSLRWTAHADNAPAETGSAPIREIPFRQETGH